MDSFVIQVQGSIYKLNLKYSFFFTLCAIKTGNIVIQPTTVIFILWFTVRMFRDKQNMLCWTLPQTVR
jgi:hypothetical protein